MWVNEGSLIISYVSNTWFWSKVDSGFIRILLLLFLVKKLCAEPWSPNTVSSPSTWPFKLSKVGSIIPKELSIVLFNGTR